MALARHRQADVAIECPVAIKELTLRLQPYHELKDPEGRVFKVCGVMECVAQLAGMTPLIEIEADVAVLDTYGVAGEIDVGIRPAFDSLMTEIKRQYVAYMQTKQEKPGQTVKPLPSERGLDMDRSERMRAINARRAAERAEAKAAKEQGQADAAGAEGGEA